MTAPENQKLPIKLIFLLFLLAIPSVSRADWEDVMRKLLPRISLQEEYTDNLNLTKTNKEDDFITTVSPGLTFSATENREAKSGLDLDYQLGLVFYAHHSENNFVSHAGTLNTWYTFGRRLTMRVWDYFLRSQEPVESLVTYQGPTGIYYPVAQRGRYTYIRNIFEPSLTYRFGPEDQCSITYQNNYYDTKNPSAEDSRGNTITPKFTYWLNAHHGIDLEYSFQTGEFTQSPDFTYHRIRGRYTYRFNPRTSVFTEYTYDTIGYDPPGIDLYVQSLSAGITHAFTKTLNGRLQVGYFRQNPERGKSTQGPTVDAGITQRTQRTSLDFTVQGGYTYDFFSTSNLGFTKYYRGIVTLTHQLAERFSVNSTGTLERDSYVGPGRKDWVWRLGAGLSYQLMKWLTAFAEVSYNGDDSNQNENDYRELRGIVRLTATRK
jgi:Putative beta-barrel porin 2